MISKSWFTALGIFIGNFICANVVLASACPDLSGSYHCTFENTGPQDLVISQRQSRGVTHFVFNGNEAIADGQVHVLPDNEELKDGLYKATCSNDSLEVWQQAKLTFASGSLETTLYLSLDPMRNLVNVNRGKMIIEGNERSLDNQGLCERL